MRHALAGPVPLETGRAYSELRELAAVFAGFSALATALTLPLALHPARLAYEPNNGDTQFSVWNVAWVAHSLVVDPAHLLDANIFYPHRWTLAFSEMNIGAGLLAAPVYWATGSPYAALNAAVLASFVLASIGTYYLARYLAHDRRAALISAVCFAFCPYVFAHLPHIQLLMTAGLPFGVLAFHRMADRPSPSRAVVLGVAMAAQALACAYYAVFVMLVVAFAVGVTALTRRLWADRTYWTAVAVAAVVAIVLTLPIAIPYLALQRQTGFSRSLDAARLNSADWRAYLASAAFLHVWMLKILGRWREVLFPGFVATVFGMSGAVVGWRSGGRLRDAAVLYGGLCAVAAWASLGPDAGLYRALYAIVPGFTFMRAPSRFGIVVIFGLSVLGAISLAALFARVRRPFIVSVILFVVAVGESLAPLRVSAVPPVEPVYRQLAALPYGAVLELPVFSRQLAFVRTRYMLNSTAHWKPLVDAYSDFIPADFIARADALGAFPSRPAFHELERDQVRYAVFHLDQYRGEMRDALFMRLNEFSPYLRRLYADDQSMLYEIVEYPK